MAGEALGRAEAYGYAFRPIHRLFQLFSRQVARPRPAPVAVERQRRAFMFTDIVRSTNLDMAARIGALATGGEILASRSAATHLGRLALSNLRTVSLKGLSEPVEVVSIDWQ